jgi:ADP-ribose pyrophosphatase YjhB (NUDIX family)
MPTGAVIRETKEETGLDIVIEGLVGVYGKRDRDELVFAFKCRVVGGCLSASDEADRHQYFEVDEIPVNTVPKQVERIQDAISSNRHPVFRYQEAPSAREFLEELGLREDVD